MEKSEKFIFAMSAFACGCATATLYLANDFYFFFLFLGFVFSVLLVFKSFLSFRFILLLLLCFLSGAFRFFYSLELPSESVSGYLGLYEINGTISVEPDIRADKIKYILDNVYLKIEDNFVLVKGKVLLDYFVFPEFDFGQKIHVTGFLEVPFKNFEFDYEDYLFRYGVYSVLKNPSDVYVIADSTFLQNIFQNIFDFKKLMLSRLLKIFGEPYASFMSGILLGARKGLSDELTEDFKNSGLTHIVAVSGYNITILIAFIYNFFWFLSKRSRIVVAFFCLILFVFLTGMSASAVRAGIMGAVSLCSMFYGRTYAVKIALHFSAFLMILIEPKILLYDIGFQLSFLATFGLIYISPFIEKYFVFVTEFFEIRNSLVLTISAQISTLPVLVTCFGLVSLICPLSNLAVLPFIPFVMLFSALALFVSFMSIKLALIFAFPAFIVSKYIFFIIKIFANVPYSTIRLDMIPVVFWALYYFICLVELKIKNNRLIGKPTFFGDSFLE